jgi:hypothetical protein
MKKKTFEAHQINQLIIHNILIHAFFAWTMNIDLTFYGREEFVLASLLCFTIAIAIALLS